MQWIYLDNNATTQPAAEVLAAMEQANRTLWANPSSVHRLGQMVRRRVELARAEVAMLIGAAERDIVFTSGGTESNNLAIRGILEHTLYHHARQTGVLITTGIEHAAVREPAQAFEHAGGRVVRIPVNPQGLVDPHDVAQAVIDHAAHQTVLLISVQWANNETGVIQPIAAIAAAVDQARQTLFGKTIRARVYLHVDATQAAGKLPVDVQAAKVDLLTLAAHKFHGPKGAGALYVRSTVRLRGQQRGGPQERQRRGGTENTSGIIGMGQAAALARAFVADQPRIAHLRALRDRLEQKLLAACPGAVVNAADAPRLCNTSNIAFPGLEAEAILLTLSERGICASAGAACSSGSLDPSPVLLAMGIAQPVAHGSVRFSLSRFTTDQDIDRAVTEVTQVVAKLGRVMPVHT